MRIKHGLSLIMVILIAFFAVTLPQQAQAENVGTTSDICQPGDGQNSIDQGIVDASHAIAGRIAQDLQNAWRSQALVNAETQCVYKLIQNYQTIAKAFNSINDPLGIILPILMGQLVSLVNQVCSDVMSDISQLKQALSICIPLPNFGSLNNNFSINVPQCSGGTAVPLFPGLTGGGGGVPLYDNIWYKR